VVTSVHGQASVEYAGLLALAAVVGAALALIAGPPLVGVIRSALVAVLPGRPHHPAPVIASAADIADVQSALAPAQEAMTPDAALLALARRHGEERAGEIADALLLDAARGVAPELGMPHTYRAWAHPGDAPYEPAGAADADHDIEDPTGAAEVRWITVAEQRRALATALAHHTSPGKIALDVVGLIPVASLARPVVGSAARRLARLGLTRVPRAIDTESTGSAVIDLAGSDDGDVPAGMRAGDVVVAWPVHRTFWRGGRRDPEPVFVRGLEFGWHPAPDYLHVIYFRPGPSGLRVVAEGFGA
jgi:hypothetical protein